MAQAITNEQLLLIGLQVRLQLPFADLARPHLLQARCVLGELE